MKPFIVPFVTGGFVIVAIALFGTRVMGEVMYRQESARLARRNWDRLYINPAAQTDDFRNGLGPAWAFDVINGAGMVGHGPNFHNTTISATADTGLLISQQPDPDVPNRPHSEQYNNATLIGFQGFQPTPAEDVLYQASIQVSDNFFGSAGMMVQPLGTLNPDGSFVGPFENGAFSLIGFCFLGPESSLLGQSGVTTEKVINWWPVQVQGLADVDIHKMHTYTLRLHWVDETTWVGIASVDGRVLSMMEMPPFGPLELHIWSDNYRFATAWTGVPSVSFQGGPEKWIRFGAISAWTEEAVAP